MRAVNSDGDITASSIKADFVFSSADNMDFVYVRSVSVNETSDAIVVTAYTGPTVNFTKVHLYRSVGDDAHFAKYQTLSYNGTDTYMFTDANVDCNQQLYYYKATIENLNVLDVDNYFKITDYLFDDDPSQALLLLDNILAKGFEAQHFIAGLAAHFRNLLMAKTPATVQLLETSDNIKDHLLQQSQKVDKQLLLRAMELANLCDFNYKMSNNKRLSVELCLLQINANYVYKKARQSQERK